MKKSNSFFTVDPTYTLSAETVQAILRVQMDISEVALSPTEVMMKIARSCQELIASCDGAVIELLEDDELVYRAAVGKLSGAIGLRLKASTSLSGLAIRNAEILLSNDAKNDPRVDQVALEKTGARSLIVVPLRYRSKNVGVLKITSSTPEAFSEQDCTLLSVLSTSLSAALANSEEYVALDEKRLLELRAAENSLSVERDRFLRSTRTIGLGVWYCDLPFSELMWDETVRAHFWVDLNAKVTMDVFYGRLHPDDRAPIEKSIESSIKNKAPYDVQYRTINPVDPSQFKWIRAMGWTDYNEANKPVRFDGITLDITILKMSAERLADSESQFRTLADAIPHLAWIAEPDGRVVWYNRRWYDYTATTYQDLDEEGWRSLHDPSILPRTLEQWQKSLSNFLPFEMTFPLKGFDGKFRRFLTRVLPVKNSAGKVTNWFGTHTDVEDEMKHQEALQAAVQIRDDFISIASHELNTPLTLLKLHAQLMKRNIEKDSDHAYSREDMMKSVEQAEMQVNRLSRLVNDMLDISRMRLGRLTVYPKPMDFGDLVKEVFDRMKPLFAEANYPEPKLFVSGKNKIHGDRDRLDQVVTNLLSNAIRYGGKKKVVVGLEPHEDFIRLTVKDKGIGMAEEAQNRIFKRFERAVDKNEVSGFGLGLFICHQIIEAHQGMIMVESSPGKGSTFTIDIPLK